MKKLLALAFVASLGYLITVKATPPGLGDSAESLTYEKDIVPIFQKKCEQCHREGGIAPMSLVGYQEVRPWTRSIREKVITRAMPPFNASGSIGYFERDPRLTQDEINTVVRWVDGGSKRGTPPAERPKIEWPNEWQSGKPDLVLRMKQPYDIRAGTVDDYELFDLNYSFPVDTWIQGIEIRPGNRREVHHASLYILPDRLKPQPDGRLDPNADGQSGGDDVFIIGGQLLLNWVPGSLPRKYEDDVAFMIPKGTRLGLQVHYAPTQQAQIDQSEVGIYYSNGVIRKVARSLYGGTDHIDIPPGAENYQLIDYRKFKTDATIFAFAAHMHLRGKSFEVKLIYPDGKTETVFDVPHFSFNWQRLYTLARPITVPKGTVAEYIAVWDNSSKNKYNPDPSQQVKFGGRTRDEMMSGTILYHVPDEKLAMKVVRGVQVEQAKN